MNFPLVTIIVPVYNVEKYIKKCLDSLIGQSYSNIEIVIIIDGSTDNSEEIIRKDYKAEHRIRVINQKNAGLGAARNTGIKNANGEYLLFVDSDDWIEPNTVEILLKQIEIDKSDICIYNMNYIYSDGTVRMHIPKIQEKRCISAREALCCELLGTEYKFHVPNKFCKRKLFVDNNIQFPVGKLYEDLATTYKLFKQDVKVSLLPDELYYYLQKRDGSITTNKISEKMFNDLFEALHGIINYVQKLDWELDKEIQSVYVENVISISNYIVSKSPESKVFYEKMKNDRDWYLMRRILQNKGIGFTKKIRGFLIYHCWSLYCWIIRTLKG